MAFDFGLLSGLWKPLAKVIDDVHTSDEERLEAKRKVYEVQSQVMIQVMELERATIQAQRDVLLAEVNGESWLQRNWRPLTMLSFVVILLNNFVLVPYAKVWAVELPMLEIPPGMWSLLTVGIGGYIASRGIEKVTAAKQLSFDPNK